MTPEELNELDDKRFLEVHETGTYFREIEDEAVNRKERIYNSAADAKTASEISKLDQEVNDRDAASFKIIPEDLSEVLVGSETAFEAVAVKTEFDPVPNDPCVTWESSDKEVADFVDNNLIAFKVGEVVITATDTHNPKNEAVSLSLSVKGSIEPGPMKGEYDYIHDEESWNASYVDGGLKLYYGWSDKANAPYKEDLWNTVENRAANVNDARKDPETGELVLDDNGNYIYDNCERCWAGAVNAPGAKYPWIVMKLPIPFEGTIKFSYEGKDDVYPWGESARTFGRGFGCASVPTELGDEFLLDNEGNTTFDVTKFEAVLVPGSAE